MSLSELIARLAPGAATSLTVAAISFPLAVITATLIAIIRVIGVPLLTPAVTALVEFMRSTPFVLQLFFVFYGLPFFGLVLSPWTSAILAIVLHYAAYQSEVIRSGFLSVPPGYWEAAHTLGMKTPTTLRRVVWPLALRVMLPPMANSFIELFKATAVISLVAVHDIVFIGGELASRTFQTMEIFVLISLFFVLIGIPATKFVGLLERKVALPV